MRPKGYGQHPQHVDCTWRLALHASSTAIPRRARVSDERVLTENGPPPTAGGQYAAISSPDYTLPAIHRLLSHLPELRALAEAADGHADTPSQAHMRESLLCCLWDLEAAMRCLPAPFQEAIYGRYERGLTEREAAHAMGLTHTALQYRVQRAERGLQKFLAGLLAKPPKKLPGKKMEAQE